MQWHKSKIFFKTVLIKIFLKGNCLILSEQVFKLITFSALHITVHIGHLLHHALLKGITEKRDFPTAQKPNAAKKVVAFLHFASRGRHVHCPGRDSNPPVQIFEILYSPMLHPSPLRFNSVGRSEI